MSVSSYAWTTLALALVGGAFLWQSGTAASAGAAPAPKMVYVRGPADPDCAGELERARTRGDAAALFVAELGCKVHGGWKCPAICKGDELLVTHVTAKVMR